jgi:ArsR family transcriptional regulator
MRQANDRIYELHAALCKALAHPARIKALDVLRGGEECVCRLAPRVGVTESNLSQLLAALRRAGLVETRRKGHSVYYRVRDKRVFRVMDEMRSILTDQLTGAGGLAAALQV